VLLMEEVKRWEDFSFVVFGLSACIADNIAIVLLHPVDKHRLFFYRVFGWGF